MKRRSLEKTTQCALTIRCYSDRTMQMPEPEALRLCARHMALFRTARIARLDCPNLQHT